MEEPTSNIYFTKDHENAIVGYANTDCKKTREKLYIEFIQPAFNEMVDKIVYTYKFTNLPNISDLKEECKAWLVTILDKYDSDRGYPAFSFYSVVTKNWFIQKTKKYNLSLRKELYFEDASLILEKESLSEEKDPFEEREQREFWEAFWNEFNSWEKMYMKDSERRVYEAIKIHFENREFIPLFKKKAIYLNLREMTKLNTKQIVSSLQKFKVRYVHFRKEWDNGNI